MAYQKKYFYTFEPTGVAEVHLVELWQDTAVVLVAEEVTAGVPPFVVEMPMIENKFQTVRGRGCIINLLSDTDMKFFDGLYHVDMREFLVLHYIDGVLDWCGYLNPEMFTEPYDQAENYIINTTGNDGFSLMDRLFFNETDATKYIDLKSEWAILKIVFDKIGLPYNDIRVSLSTTFADFTGAANSTILHETYIESSNFYDEDNLPMTLREVLQSILEPYGAFITQSGASIYITDINTIAAGGSVTYKQFNASTYAYIADIVEVNEKTVASIGYLGTGQQIEISGGTNRQLVTYSPYPNKDITEELIVTPGEFATVPASYSSKDGYFYKTLEGHIYYEAGAPADFEESREALNSDDSFVYLRMPLNLNGDLYLSIIDGLNPYLNIQSTRLRDNITPRLGSRRYLDGVSILITGSALVKTKDNPYDESYSPAEIAADADKVTQATVDYGFFIGDKTYNRGTDAFVDSTILSNPLVIGSANGETIGNKWVDFSNKMNVSYFDEQILINGKMVLGILSNTAVRITGGELIDNSAPLQEIWIRNLKISIVNKDGSEVGDNDIEYIGELDKTFKEEGDKVTLTTGSLSLFTDRGMKVWNDGSNYKVIDEWTRAAQTFRIEELLLGSLSSNYRAGYVSLLNMNLKNSFSLINVLTDTYTGSRKFMITALSIDYYNNVSNADMVEISEDELTIVK